MVSVSLGLQGITVEFEKEFAALYRKIQEHHNKNKNDICRTLELIDDFIALWYNYEKKMFSKLLGLHGETLDERDEDFRTIFEFSRTRDCHNTGAYCNSYFKYLAQDYRESKDKKIRDIIDKIGGIGEVEQIAEKINTFSTTAYNEKLKWVDTSMEGKRWTVSASDIRSWLDELQKIGEDVRTVTSEIRHNLGCSPTINQRLSKELSNENSMSSS